MFKRALDIVISILALVIFSPIILIVAVLVRINLGSPVIFSQMRPGMHHRPFKMLKFRSMKDDKDQAGNLLADAQRLPRFGQLLRASSLDELPGLINVLKGDMSIVGPRPLLVEYLPLYNLVQNFEYDVWYVDNQSLWLDVRIILLTAMKVIRRDDINYHGEATMTKFTGSKTKDKGFD